MRKTLIYAIVMLTMSIMAACNTDTQPSNVVPADTCFDFATVASISEGGATFTLQKSEDSPLITYSSTYNLTTAKDIKVGDRIIIMYIPAGGTPYVTGNITLYGYRLLDNTDQNLVITDSKNTSNWASSAIDPSIFNRTGDYINIQAQVVCQTAEKPKKLILAVNESTIDDEIPELHIIYIPASEGFNTYTAYASFDISELWSKSTCKGINIMYQSNNGSAAKKFTKDEGITPRPDM